MKRTIEIPRTRASRTLGALALAAAFIAVPLAAANHEGSPPLTTQIARGYIDTSTLPAPGVLRDAADVLGLVTTDASAACNTIGIPDATRLPTDIGAVDVWYGSGEGGEIHAAKHNGEDVDPVALLDYLQRNAEQGSSSAMIINAAIRHCSGKYDFCDASFGIWPFTKQVFCFVCCTSGEPWATCSGQHLTAVCGCDR